MGTRVPVRESVEDHEGVADGETESLKDHVAVGLSVPLHDCVVVIVRVALGDKGRVVLCEGVPRLREAVREGECDRDGV